MFSPICPYVGHPLVCHVHRAGEVQVLDFQTQQMKLLPLVATAYALTFTSRNMSQFYQDVIQRIEKGALDELPQVHIFVHPPPPQLT